MTDVVCSDPNHASRQNQPGWQTILGTTDLPASPAGVLCDACAAAARAQQAQTDAVLAALAINRATIEQALAQALHGLASIDTQLQTLSTITLSGTTAQQLAQVQAALRGIGTNLRPVVAGVRRAVRLLSNQLDGTT